MHNAYHQQAQLMLTVLPEISKSTEFALHGGTAINLFERDMPRLSVDIDLTYTRIADRASSLTAINHELEVIQQRLEEQNPVVRVQHNSETCKLQVAAHGAVVKVEVSPVIRGLLGEPRTLPLCEAAQEQFDAFCAASLVPKGQLYGGKLCAALDRQHPRDLFDVRTLVATEILSDEIRSGLLLALVSSNRPTHELLAPNRLDQRSALEHQFSGMTITPFSYADYEATRTALIRTIRSSLTAEDKTFLLGFNQLQPDWDNHPFADFPAVRWKLLNLERLRSRNADKWLAHLEQLRSVLTDD